MIEKLKDIEVGSCGDPYYSLDEIKKTYNEIVEIDTNNWLVMHSPEPEVWREFALFSFAQSSCDDSNIRVVLVFHGHGTGSVLRECRHTYWGPDSKGYTFYLPAKAVIKALQHLEQYFDFN